MEHNDTIAAVATPPGTGGVAIIRISGEGAHDVLRNVFSRQGEMEHAKLYYGNIEQDGVLLDQGMAVMFYAPHSYTGEDTAELHLHGSVVGVQEVLRVVLSCGARPAMAGEFTRRAFLNGKMDLSQAEAVCDFISAMGEAGAKTAMKQLHGQLKEKILSYQDVLTNAIAEVEAAVEYPEEDLEFEITHRLKPVLEELLEKISTLAKTYGKGKVIRQGLDVVIAGKPNAGKSSLLNALLEEDRAIVADVPGTTRDTVEQTFTINGIAINIKDTAGIRSTEDIIENEGVKRAENALKKSDLVLFVLDGEHGISSEDHLVFKTLENQLDRVLFILNKLDASERRTETEIKETFSNVEWMEVSAKTGLGLNALKQRIYELAAADLSLQEDMIITNARHRHALENAAKYLDDAVDALEAGMDMDCITIDLNAAWSALGEITGKTVSEEIIDRIFEKFCLGK